MVGATWSPLLPALTCRRCGPRNDSPIDRLIRWRSHWWITRVRVHDMRFHVAPLSGLGVEGYVLTGQGRHGRPPCGCCWRVAAPRPADRIAERRGVRRSGTRPRPGPIPGSWPWWSSTSVTLPLNDVRLGRESGEPRPPGGGGRLEQAPGPIPGVARVGGQIAALLRDSARMSPSRVSPIICARPSPPSTCRARRRCRCVWPGYPRRT